MSKSMMSPAKTGIARLLIASAIDADVYRRLLESPEATYEEFDLAEEDRELLRHPDHRLLRVLGAALAEESTSTSSSPAVETTQTSMPPKLSLASAPLPDISLVLTLVPCAIYDGAELRNFAYAAWVNPLAEGADPQALPPPPGTVLPGKPLAPLHAVVRVSAIQMQDAAGKPLVGLSASLLQSTNMLAAPPPETACNPAALAPVRATDEVQAAIAAVRRAPAENRYGELIKLLRALHPEGAS